MPNIYSHELSDDEWLHEATSDELQRNEQNVTNQDGQTIAIRKYQSLCRRLGRWIPIALPTPEFPIFLSDLKPEVRRAIENIYHPELKRLVSQQAVLRLFEPLESNHILALDVNSMSN